MHIHSSTAGTVGSVLLPFTQYSLLARCMTGLTLLPQVTDPTTCAWSTCLSSGHQKYCYEISKCNTCYFWWLQMCTKHNNFVITLSTYIHKLPVAYITNGPKLQVMLIQVMYLQVCNCYGFILQLLFFRSS